MFLDATRELLSLANTKDICPLLSELVNKRLLSVIPLPHGDVPTDLKWTVYDTVFEVQ